jgi:hemoglobin-like flavoprotein
MLSTKEKALVQDSWKLVQPISAQAAELFYGKLFELDPSLRRLFKGDMKEQGAKLMKTLAFAVASLNDLERLVPIVQELARRHVGYGVQEAHYATVGQALLWTLTQGLGTAATPETLEAWGATYMTLSSVMVDAARP